ncbi:MAG: hypothetical protein IID53_13945 [Proteobacteria bacterium]|nr:hypothetical protein [Pseudomonadota bacterium]
MQKPALYTASVIFAIVGIAHFVRYFLRLKFILGATAIPLSVSLIAGIVLAVLTVWMVRAARSP